MVQVVRNGPVRIDYVLLFLLWVDLGVVVTVGLSGLLSYCRRFLGLLPRVVYFGLQAALWLFALILAASFLPEMVRQLLLQK